MKIWKSHISRFYNTCYQIPLQKNLINIFRKKFINYWFWSQKYLIYTMLDIYYSYYAHIMAKYRILVISSISYKKWPRLILYIYWIMTSLKNKVWGNPTKTMLQTERKSLIHRNLRECWGFKKEVFDHKIIFQTIYYCLN